MSNCKTEQTAVATDMCPTVSFISLWAFYCFKKLYAVSLTNDLHVTPPLPRPNTAPSHAFLFWPIGLAYDVTGSHAPSLLAVGHAKDTVHRQNCCSELWSALTASGDTMELWGRIVDVELRRALWTVTENRCFDWTDGFVPCCDRLTSSCCGVQCCTYQDLAALCCCQSVCTARTAQCSVVTTCVHWNGHNEVTVNERSFVATAVVTQKIHWQHSNVRHILYRTYCTYCNMNSNLQEVHCHTHCTIWYRYCAIFVHAISKAR